MGETLRMPVERPPIPTEERRPAWRRACLADVRCAVAFHREFNASILRFFRKHLMSDGETR
jgi:hypothetical protein